LVCSRLRFDEACTKHCILRGNKLLLFEHCFIAAGNGGGLIVLIPNDVEQLPNIACDGSSYWTYNHSAVVSLWNTTIAYNSAGTGGGAFIGPGGAIVFDGGSVEGNKASRFGGGLALGGDVGLSPCSFTASNSRFGGNVAGHGSSQLSMGCSGDLIFANTLFDLNTANSQVGSGFLSCFQHLARLFSLSISPRLSLLLCRPGCSTLGG
jgi:hypothetical protein